MNEIEAIELMKKAAKRGEDDCEMGHSDADDILCDLLRELGYNNLIEQYEKVPKWYA